MTGVYARDVSIIVPTMNRSEFVIKMLSAFRDMGFGGTVLIGDSSQPEHYARTSRAIETMALDFPVRQKPFPGQKSYECICALNADVTTPYLMWMCDDDILVPETLAKCATFLDAHPDYSGAGGRGVMLGVAGEDFSVVVDSAAHNPRAVGGQTASARVMDLLTDYRVSSYSLCRTEQFVRKFRPNVDAALTDLSLASELLPTVMQAAQGKVAMLEDLFVVRQEHARRYILPDMFDWITKPDWAASYAVFERAVSDEIARQDLITPDVARAQLKRWFWTYLNKALHRSYAHRYTPARQSGLRRKLAGLSPLRRMWHWGRDLHKPRSDRMSLPWLLSEGSPYHRDFLPIYRTIVGGVDRPVAA
jgi:glycosyltransferase domain-containing protein